MASVPWGVRFPVGSYPFEAHLRADFIPTDAALSMPVHPVQLYLALNALLLFVATSAVWRRWRDRPYGASVHAGKRRRTMGHFGHKVIGKEQAAKEAAELTTGEQDQCSR